MTAGEAKRALKKASDRNVTVYADVTSFGGWSKGDIVSALEKALLVEGLGPSFVVDGTLTVVFNDGLIYVIGAKNR